MSLYSYAIIDSNSKISETPNGLEGVCVYNIPYRDIGIVVSESEQIHPVRDKTLKADGRPAAGGTVSNGVQNITQEHILKHEEVVEKLMESFTVLPISFPTFFKKEDNVLFMMKEYYSDFRENLDRLYNKVEFGIKVIWPADTIKQRIINAYNRGTIDMATPKSSSVKNFVKARFENYKIDKEFEEEANRCVVVVDDYFNKIACEKKLQKLQSNDLLLNAAYLVEKERQNEFRQTFEQLKSFPSDLKYLFSGPWPPHNFITLTKKSNSMDYFNIGKMSAKVINNLHLVENNTV